MKKTIIYLISLLCASSGFAQNDNFGNGEIFYDSELYGSLIAHTNGWGLGLTKAKQIKDGKKWLFSAELVTMKHPKEDKRLNPYEDNTKRYVFGKMNYMMALRPSVGRQGVLYNKASRSGVQVGFNYRVGPSLALLRPVYLEIAYPTILNSPDGQPPSTEVYNPDIHNPDMIVGRASYFRGFDKSKVYPGLFAKLGFDFEFASASDLIRGIETGITADVYYKRVPLMAFSHNQFLFLTGYVSLQLGKKSIN